MFLRLDPFIAFLLVFIYEILRVGISTDYLLFAQKHSTIKHQRKPINIKRQKVGITLYFIIAFLSPFLELLWIDFIFRKIGTIGPFIDYNSGLLIWISVIPTILFGCLSNFLSDIAE